jgi:hypothetical protein
MNTEERQTMQEALIFITDSWTPSMPDTTLRASWLERRTALATKLRAALERPEQDHPTGYWQGQYSKDGGATLYEEEQVSVFGHKYINIPLYTHPAPAKELTCTWTEDDEGTWNTTCGNAFVFTEEGPLKNGFLHCGYCGGKLVEVRQE